MNKLYVALIILLFSVAVAVMCKKYTIYNILYKDTLIKETKSRCGVDIYLNETQRRDISLEKVLEKLSSKPKIELNNCKVNHFTIATIDVIKKKDIDAIVNLILDRLNSISKFHFKRTEYVGITMFKSVDERIRYMIDCYAQDLTQGYSTYNQRFLIDVVIFPNIHINNIKSNSQIPSYSLSYPEEDQIIPLPMDVITTANEVLNYKGVNIHESQTFSMLYVNEVRILNSNLVLSYKDANKMACLGGITDNTLEFTGYCGNNDPKQLKSKEYNKWITLDNQPKKQGQWPCTLVPSFYWDDLGLYPKVKPTPECPGLRSSTKPEELQADYWMATLDTPYFHGPNFWLFDQASGNPTFINGTRG